jgi:diguanylate cyclase (GGDEF)-like protein
MRLSAEYQEQDRTGRPLSMLIIDIDYFKTYNDKNGHLAGDECLIKVAKKIQQNATRAGDLAARYGGEEFAVILADTPINGAVVVAEKIRRDIRALKIPNASSLGDVLTVSIGAATLESMRQGSMTDLIKTADKALYMAKEKGRDRVETFEVNRSGGKAIR